MISYLSRINEVSLWPQAVAEMLASIEFDSVVSVMVIGWTFLVAVAFFLLAISLQEKKSRAAGVIVPTEREVKRSEEDSMEAAIIKLWKSEPWKREFVGEWSMIEGSRKGFYEYIVFSGKSESAARNADSKPFGNIIRVKVVDDVTLGLPLVTLDQNVMRIDTTGLKAHSGEGPPWCIVGGEASKVQADHMLNYEKISWDEDSRALVRTRDCPEGGFSWTQTRTIDRGIMRVTVVYVKASDGASASFSMAMHKTN